MNAKSMGNKKVVIMGLGYIGLPTAAAVSETDWLVHGVDVRSDIIDTINQGKIHIVEPGLEEVISKAIDKGRLFASTQPAEADVFLIAVPTPFKGNFQPDISYVISALEAIVPYIKEGNLVILESTSPVKTLEILAERTFSLRPELKNKVSFAYCPERVLPGNVLFELKNNDRVIGGIDDESNQKAIEFYSSFVRGELHLTNSRTAEMCKLTENSYRDANIAFANELSMICDQAEINVWELIKLANKHPRVNILQPGIGVGGHCLAVDPWFLVADYPSVANIIRTSREVNLKKTKWVKEMILKQIEGNTENTKKSVALMGLSYKPDIDDVRESPAVDICLEIIASGAKVFVVEPNVESHPKFKLTSIYDAISKADIVVFLVKHSIFYSLDLKGKSYFDFCGISENAEFTSRNGLPVNI